jgi:tryptophanyl-tRNA synthetase
MRILSGIQPSSSIHIGNYFGAIKQWLLLENHECIFFIADLHCLTTYSNNLHIYQKSLETLATYIACGIDPHKSKIFLQSQNYNHTYFLWILSSITHLGEINRMVQMKDKSKTYDNVGVLTYPILMAADILLYNPHIVPVGQDQWQHLELARDLGERLNNLLKKDIFHLPQPFKENIYPVKILDLTDGTKKMSKTNPKGALFLTDSDEEIIKKIKKAKTDQWSMPTVNEPYDHRPEIKNLINIYHSFTGISIEKILEKFGGQNLSIFKEDLIKMSVFYIKPIREKINELMANKDFLEKILENNKKWAIEESQSIIKIINEYFYK